MKYRFLFIFLSAALIIFLTVLAGTSGASKGESDTSNQTVLRLIGHKILLSAGDTKSRVMPIKKLSAHEFQIHFENPLSLEPDSIFNIITRTTRIFSLPKDYTADVLDCSRNVIVYSFVMSGIDSNVIVPCRGRTLPKGCYYLSLRFSRSRIAGTKAPYILGAGILLVLLSAYFIHYYIKRRKSNPVSETEDNLVPKAAIQIGEFLFHFDQRYLEINREKIEVTEKESRLLYILASAPNKIVDRQQLQKEVWENEGVIVTRSLDVFISKLRRKLEKDPAIKLVNVHGKGYKLEVPDRKEAGS